MSEIVNLIQTRTRNRYGNLSRFLDNHRQCARHTCKTAVKSRPSRILNPDECVFTAIHHTSLMSVIKLMTFNRMFSFFKSCIEDKALLISKCLTQLVLIMSACTCSWSTRASICRCSTHHRLTKLLELMLSFTKKARMKGEGS